MQKRNLRFALLALPLILTGLAHAQASAKTFASVQGTVTVMPAGFLATWANYPVVYVYTCPLQTMEGVTVQITSTDGSTLTVVLPPLGGGCFAGGAVIGLDAVSYAQILPEAYASEPRNHERRGK